MPRPTNNTQPVPSICELIMGSLALIMLLATCHFLAFLI